MLNINDSYAPVKLKQISYAVNVREYLIDTTFEQVQKVEVTHLGGPPYPELAKISFSDIGAASSMPSSPNWNVGVGEPDGYYVRFMESGQTLIGGSSISADSWVIGFDPIPGSANTNNVNVWYIGTAGTVTAIDTTLPDLPADFHDLIPRRMCIFAAVADGSPNVDFYKSVYNDSLLRKLNRVVRGPQQLEERIQVDWE